MNIRGYLSIGAVFTAFMLGMAPAHAAYSTCDAFSPDVTGFVTNTDGCEIDDTIFNDSDAAFDARNWFGVTDWDFDAKDNDPGTGVDEGGNTSGAVFTGDNFDGSWSLPNLVAGDLALLVFKDGTQADPHAMVVYLVDASIATSGLYDSPFFNSQGQQQATSHISVYLSQGDMDVPVAGTVWLMALGLGLIGLAGSRRRKA